MMINDAHCHFFSPAFFSALAAQTARVPTPSAADLCRELGWDDPVDVDTLADRWRQELDRHDVARAVLIASVPGDEASVGAAVARHPDRFVGFFMVDPGAADVVDRITNATRGHGLRGVCLFPAMHRVSLEDPRTDRVVGAAASIPGVSVFVHCGRLSVGVRARLGLPSPFDLSLGSPLGVARLAAAHPDTTFIIPHFGAGRFRETLEAAARCSNIVLDTSSSNAWIGEQPDLTLEGVFRTALDVVGPARLLFGTDSSFFPRGWQAQVHEAQLEALTRCGASSDERALVLGGNFARLFPAV
jgi:hypothetical protein